MVIATLIGTAVGPAAIGYVTDHVLGDERKVGIAIASCCTIFCIGAVLALAMGMAACRRIMTDENIDKRVAR